MSAALLASTKDASEVHGVHGAPGVTRWTCFASRRDLTAHCEAVEWASVPPGGVSGEHLHTRTEEIYFIVAGTGEMLLNGVPHPVGPRSLVLTGVGTAHGLRNTGTTDLDWVVVESFSPATSAAVTGRRTRQGEVPVSRSLVVDLGREQAFDTSEVFSGPLRRAEIVVVEPGAERTFDSGAAEHSLFVLSGGARVTSGAAETKVGSGHCVTVPLGGAVTVHAEDTPAELFVVTLAVPDHQEDA